MTNKQRNQNEINNKHGNKSSDDEQKDKGKEIKRIGRREMTIVRITKRRKRR